MQPNARGRRQGHERLCLKVEAVLKLFSQAGLAVCETGTTSEDDSGQARRDGERADVGLLHVESNSLSSLPPLFPLATGWCAPLKETRHRRVPLPASPLFGCQAAFASAALVAP